MNCTKFNKNLLRSFYDINYMIFLNKRIGTNAHTNTHTHTHTHTQTLSYKGRSPLSVEAKLLEFVGNKFELQSRYYVHFRRNTLGKSMTPPLIPSSSGLNSTTAILLPGWLSALNKSRRMTYPETKK